MLDILQELGFYRLTLSIFIPLALLATILFFLKSRKGKKDRKQK